MWYNTGTWRQGGNWWISWFTGKVSRSLITTLLIISSWSLPLLTCAFNHHRVFQVCKDLQDPLVLQAAMGQMYDNTLFTSGSACSPRSNFSLFERWLDKRWPCHWTFLTHCILCRETMDILVSPERLASMGIQYVDTESKQFIYVMLHVIQLEKAHWFVTPHTNFCGFFNA